MKSIELTPIQEHKKDYDKIEFELIKLLKEEVYQPLLSEMGRSSLTIQNSRNPLVHAILAGRLTFYRGEFTGKLDSSISSQLKKLGAKWKSWHEVFAIPMAELPPEIRQAIETSESRFKKTTERIDLRLQRLSPAEVADKLKLEDIFSTTLFKIEKDFHKSLKGFTVAPVLTLERRQTIAKEYTNNLKLGITDWLKSEVQQLRKKILAGTFEGVRYEELIGKIVSSYGVSRSKAKFLASQETKLLVGTFKESRYDDAGIKTYRWRCVSGSSNHPVRRAHKAHDGKTFRFDDPPVVSEPGQKLRRANAGMDFNCRCIAIPIVRF